MSVAVLAAAGPTDAGRNEGQFLAEASRLRLRAYAICLLLAFSLYTLAFAWSGGWLFALFCAGVLVLLALLSLLPAVETRLRHLAAAAGLAGLTALAFPLLPAIWAGASLPEAIRGATIWPQVLVALFAGRLLSEICEARFARFWRDPFGAAGPARTQSLLGAVLTGGSMLLLFYRFTAGVAVAPERMDPAAIVLRAFVGETVIHVAILALFFTVLGAILDAALLALNEGAALNALRRALRARASAGPQPRRELARWASERLPELGHTRVMQIAREAADGGGSGSAGRSLRDFHGASRKLIRALLSFLPLIGFLGTVIGLTAAIGGLPNEIGPEAGRDLDISSSLLGLALKFETTLLGLLGGLLGTLLLAFVEKRESEQAAEARRLIEAAGHD